MDAAVTDGTGMTFVEELEAVVTAKRLRMKTLMTVGVGCLQEGRVF